MDFFGYGIDDIIPCSIKFPRCTGKAIDICHIEPKGMGGNPNKEKDRIENLIAGCRNCHEDSEGRFKELLKEKQRLLIKQRISN
jgi:hypothetical protein